VSEQKTEKPTPKKLREARKKGQVSKSKDITQSVVFLTAAAVLAFAGPLFVASAKALFSDSFRPELLTGELRADEVMRRLGYGGGQMLMLSAPFLAAVTVAAVAVEFLQVQALFAPEAIQFKADKLNFIKGLQNIFGKSKTYLELAKNLVKFAMVSGLLYFVVRGSLRDIILSARANPETTGKLGASLMFTLLFRVGILFLLLGAADFLLQKKLHLKELMMSKYEVKKEYKEDEGDPHIRHQRRHLHQQILAQSMVQNVPRASVVVVNPTHLAVAIQYDELSMSAPQVTAKGQEKMARSIRELAVKSGVPITRNVALAHSLFQVELGGEIPEELYEAVAEVLNWVYQLAPNVEEQ
jgi:flagellar biosynthesis protein FlhB